LPLTPHIVIIVTLTRHSLVAGPEHRQHVNWIRLIFLSDRLQRLSFALDFSNVQITLLSFLLLRVDPVNGSIVIRLRKLLDELVGTILLLNELNHLLTNIRRKRNLLVAVTILIVSRSHSYS
jgi:hypothetical protein